MSDGRAVVVHERKHDGRLEGLGHNETIDTTNPLHHIERRSTATQKFGSTEASAAQAENNTRDAVGNTRQGGERERVNRHVRTDRATRLFLTVGVVLKKREKKRLLGMTAVSWTVVK